MRYRVRFAVTLAAALAVSCIRPVFAQSSSKPSPPPDPCSAPEHRQFDFWIGDWNVTTPDGKQAGTNRIESIAGGCGLLENWSDAGGGSGKSLNYYSPRDQKWHQTWTGSGGSFLMLEGGLEDGKMVLRGTTRRRAGGNRLDRITWTPLPDGRVRQHWQVSTDGGTTWSDAFLGIYTKK